MIFPVGNHLESGRETVSISFNLLSLSRRKVIQERLTVEHHNTGDEGLPETSRQGDEGVLIEAFGDDVELVVSEREVDRVDRGFDRFGVVFVFEGWQLERKEMRVRSRQS